MTQNHAQRFSDKPNCISTVNRATPTIISGRTNGASIKVNANCLPRKSYLVADLEAKKTKTSS